MINEKIITIEMDIYYKVINSNLKITYELEYNCI